MTAWRWLLLSVVVAVASSLVAGALSADWRGWAVGFLGGCAAGMCIARGGS